MKTTAQIFLAYLKCSTKCWLISQGKTGKGNEYAEWVKDRTDFYNGAGIKRLLDAIPQKECVSPKLFNRSHMKIASQEHPSASNRDKVPLATNLQAVEQLTFRRKGRARYIPIRFIFRNKVTRNDRLLLGFDALTLSEAVGHSVSYGKIVHGDDYSVLKVKTTALLGKTRKLIEKIATLLESPSPPDLVLNRNCPECEFKPECQQKAVESDDLSLLQGMTSKEREINHKKGIFTVNQLSYTFRPRRRPRWLRGRNEKYHHSLKALAMRDKKIHVVGNPELKVNGTPICLDVEALPDRGFYYLIGARIRSKNSTVQHSLWANSINDEEAIWREFLSILAAVEDPILIHYGSFETTFFRTMAKRYGTPLEGSAAANSIKSAVNLLSIVFGQVYFPCYSNGLKEVSRFLGFEWSEPNVSGIQTISWREKWHHSREATLKQKLITYNSEDCEAVFRVMDYLSKLSNRISGSSGTSDDDFVRAESLPSAYPFRFRKIKFAFPELEEINNAAYWDYQKERLLIKSNDSTGRPVRRAAKRREVKLRPNKVVSLPAPLQCSICGKTKIYKHQAYTKTILDLKFQRTGIKGLITKYLYCRYRCAACKTVFGGSKLPWKSSEKFGVNLQAMTIYLNIGLRIPQQRVAIFFNEILGFNLSRAVPNRIKHLAALYYKPAVDKLMEKIIGGSLIHADETKVNLKGKAGYVWAFSNMEEVVYLYAPTREGNWVLELLKEFKGVLVSDFYAVYDSLDCPQQKCLIHLIRDMNDDLLKEPFNDETKSLVADFAVLVKPMIETVDRFGLKAR